MGLLGKNMEDHSKNSIPEKILWTGGWDSTFQILRLLIKDKVKVAPYYVIDPDRKSIGMELKAMRRIRSHLFTRFPETCERLEPTQYFLIGDISPNPSITDSWKRIRARQFIGDQYEWLARFCEAQGICNIQMCIEKDDSGIFYALLRRVVKEVIHEGRKTYKVSENFSNTDEYAVFKYFSFPIFDLTKTEMARVAIEQGLDKIMNMTWFCHTPIKGNPCGKCNPCTYTIKEGLGWRVAPRRRILSRFARAVVRPLKAGVKLVLSKKQVNNPSA